MKTPEIEVTVQYKDPQPVKVTIGDVSFWMGGAFATFYRMFEYTGQLEEFMADAKPFYWKKYTEALHLKQAEEERTRQMHEGYQEQRRIWQNDKKRRKRMEMKNGISRQENAVQPL